MIDGLKVAKYLTDTGLKIQEFWFLYASMTCEDNIRNGNIKVPQTDNNKVFNEMIHHYFTNNKPDIASDLKWSDVAYKLQEEGWLEISQNQNVKPLKLKNCITTEKFKQHFLISDTEQAFNEFLEVYPRFVTANGKKYATIDKSPEELAETYNDIILKKGNALLHQRCLMITEMFIRDNNYEAPYKISEYFIRFAGIAIGYEKPDSQKRNKTNTGRRQI